MYGIKGTHPTTKSWLFERLADRDLADAIATIGEQTGIEINDVRYIFMHTLRMLHSDSEWAGSRKQEAAQ